MNFKFDYNISKIMIFAFLIIGSFLLFINVVNSYGSCSQYGVMAYEDYDGYCKCISGYIFGKNFLGESYCVSGDSTCKDDYGYGARYDSLTKKCKCSYGYIFGKDIIGRTQCIEQNQYCKNKYGYNSKYNSLSDSCECGSNYFLRKNSLGSYECISSRDICKDQYGFNAKYNSLTDKCECNSGYEMTQKKFGSGLECVSCSSKYGIYSSYNYLSKKCECDDGYTLNDENKCVEKQNNVYFILKEINTDEKLAIIKSEYDNRYYFIQYSYGCYSSSIRRYLNHRIVINLGTDFNIDKWDKIVLSDDDEVCDIKKVERVYSDFTLEPDEEDKDFYSDSVYIPVPVGNDNIQNKVEDKSEEVVFIPEEPTEKVEKEKKCDNGYAFSLDKTACIKIPEHAYVVDSPTDVWLCEEDYKESGNFCVSNIENIKKKEGDTEADEYIRVNITSSNSDSKIKSMTSSIVSVFFRIFKKVTSWFK